MFSAFAPLLAAIAHCCSPFPGTIRHCFSFRHFSPILVMAFLVQFSVAIKNLFPLLQDVSCLFLAFSRPFMFRHFPAHFLGAMTYSLRFYE